MSTNAVLGFDGSFLRDNPILVQTYNNLDWESQESITNLIGVVEKIVVKYNDPNENIKANICKIFELILDRYPYLGLVWKKYTAVKYQLYGLEDSIKVLESAVKAFPDSVELWCDYLSVLEANKTGSVDERRSKYQTAKDNIGYNFLSHQFWDKYIQFETTQEDWEAVMSIYHELLKIPLHQYAKYFKAYMAFNSSEGSKKLTKEDITKELQKTQTLVNSIWRFESQIKHAFFSVNGVSQVEAKNWKQYLSYIKEQDIDIKIIETTYRRCLIPCAKEEFFWLAYISWQMNQKYPSTRVLSSFQKAIRLLPSSATEIRNLNLSYMSERYRDSPDIFYESYCDTLESLIKDYPSDHSLIWKLLNMIKRHNYGNKWGDDSKEILQKQNLYAKFLETKLSAYVQNSYRKTDTLTRILNDGNVSVLIVALIKLTWLVLKNKIQTRKYFTQYARLPLVKNSSQFWVLLYQFEKSEKNFIKLNALIKTLSYNNTLPLTIKNDIFEDYRRFYMLNCEIDDNRNLTVFDDPLLLSILGINEPRVGTKGAQSVSQRDNGHPGIATNNPIHKNSLILNNSSKLSQFGQPLPKTISVDKLFSAPKYMDYYTNDFLNKR